MPKIVTVKVWGFQSHIDTKYDLHEGLNVFTGPSGAGKTSGTIRAIRWLVKGEPAGEGFLHTVYEADGITLKRQAEEAGVEVKLDNGVTVRKTRSKGKTRYWVIPQYSEPFEKAEVPEAVKEALGIRSTSFGDFEVDLHFAYQLAAPFLLSEPGSAGAKVLGRLAGTEAVDGAIKATAKDTYAARQDKAAADKEYERKVAQLLDYQDIEELQNQLDACDFLLEGITASVARCDKVAEWKAALDVVETSVARADMELARLSVLPSLEDDLLDIEKAQSRYNRLLDLYGQLGRATATVENLTRLLEGYAGLDAAAYWLEQAEANHAKCDSLLRLSKDYHSAQEAVKTAQEVIDETADLDVAADLLCQAEASLGRQRSIQLHYLGEKAAQNDVERAKSLLGSLAGLTEAVALVEQAEVNLARRMQISEQYRIWHIKDSTRLQAAFDLEGATAELQAGEAELAEAWSATGGTCPLCEQAVQHTH